MERAGLFGWVVVSLIPFLCGVLAISLANIPISFSGGILPPALLGLMPLYFWCLVRPDLMPPLAAFVLGLFQDLLSGSPPGIWAASFIAAYAIVDRQREAFAGLSSWAAILGFGLVALIAHVCAWLLAALYYRELMPVAPVVGVFSCTVLLYAPTGYVLGVIHRRMIGAARAVP